jgi:hypothetical protein
LDFSGQRIEERQSLSIDEAIRLEDRGPDQIQPDLLHHERRLNRVRRRLEVLVGAADEERVEVFRKEVVQEEEVARTPGEHLAPEAHAEPVAPTHEDGGVSNVEPDAAVDRVRVDVATKTRAGNLVGGVQIESKASLPCREFIRAGGASNHPRSHQAFDEAAELKAPSLLTGPGAAAVFFLPVVEVVPVVPG